MGDSEDVIDQVGWTSSNSVGWGWVSPLVMTESLKECQVTFSILLVKIERNKDYVPNIRPVSCLFQDSAVQVRKWKETAYIAKKCFQVVSFIQSSSVIILSSVQNGPEVTILPIKMVKVESELRKGVMSLHVSKWSWWGDFLSDINFEV